MRSRALDRVAVALGAGLMSLASLLAAPLILSVEKSDPSFYLSYALDYRSLAERFGQTYHGNRLAYLLPEMAAFRLLGPESGYLVLRWAALAAAVTTVFALARPRVGTSRAALVAAAVALTPWLPRQLLWVNYDGFSAVYLLGMALLLLRPGRSRRGDLLAGVLALLAINTNLVFTAVVGGAALGWWFACRAPWRERALRAGWMLGGAVLAEALLSVVLGLLGAEGPWLAEALAVDVALRIAGDATWFIPLPDAVARSPYLVVVLALGILAAAVPAERDRPDADGVDAARLGAVWVLSTGAVILFLHIVMRSLWLGWPMYNVTLIAPTVVSIVGLMERLGASRDDRVPGGWATSAAASAGLAWVWSSGRLHAWTVVLAAVLILATTALVVRHRGSRPARPSPAVVALLPLVLVATAASATQIPTTAGFTDLAMREAFEWDTFDRIVDVRRLVESEVGPDRDLVFWHRTDEPSAEWLRRINMAYYGTGGGRLHVRGDAATGLPGLPQAQVEAVRERAPVTVVLLALSRAELTSGLVALSTAVDGARQTATAEFPGRTYDLHVALVEVD